MNLIELIETKAGVIAACKLTKAEIADILLEISGEAQRQAEQHCEEKVKDVYEKGKDDEFKAIQDEFKLTNKQQKP